MKQRLITSIALAYVAADLTGWYETIPERLICCIGLGLAIAAVWIQIEERIENMYKNLLAEMAKRKIGIGDIAQLLSVHRNTVHSKIYDKRFFVDEAIAIHQKFFADIDFFYLFKKE